MPKFLCNTTCFVLGRLVEKGKFLEADRAPNKYFDGFVAPAKSAEPKVVSKTVAPATK
jgi:hypothetical protein